MHRLSSKLPKKGRLFLIENQVLLLIEFQVLHLIDLIYQVLHLIELNLLLMIENIPQTVALDRKICGPCCS